VSSDWYDRILLEADQRELLDLMIQADNAIAKEKRTPFILVPTDSDDLLLREGFPRTPVVAADLAVLVDRRLLRAHREAGSRQQYDVTPEGRQYWAEMKRRIGSEVKVVEAEIRTFLDSPAFSEGFPQAHDRWTEAANELWGADSAKRFTDIGHRCREAMQFFAAALMQRAGISDEEVLCSDAAKTVDRLRAVIARKGDLSERHRAFLDALVHYWRTVSDLVQRQEHGAQKAGDELTWEDARRVVFQTAIVMYEVSRALG
jgi:hypothetical protein